MDKDNDVKLVLQDKQKETEEEELPLINCIQWLQERQLITEQEQKSLSEEQIVRRYRALSTV